MLTLAFAANLVLSLNNLIYLHGQLSVCLEAEVNYCIVSYTN